MFIQVNNFKVQVESASNCNNKIDTVCPGCFPFWPTNGTDFWPWSRGQKQSNVS